MSNKECARRLSRSVSTIGRELKRNKTRVAIGDDWNVIYEPLHAQAVAEERKRNAWNAKEPLKNKKVYAYVLEHLRQGWSPEQIAGRLKYVDYPSNKSWHICHETIYQFIYKEKTDKTKQGVLQCQILDKRLSRNTTGATVTDHEKPLYEYLRRKQIRRRKRGGRKSQRVRIPDRVSIHQRPVVISKRKELGHWEGDSLVGKGHMNGLHTEYERLASLIRFELMDKINAESFVNAAKKIFSVLPEKARKSTTLDNGSEHVRHTEIKREYGMDTYFADPYSAWQRGGNENANMWIRYYFPKGTDFSKITDEELKDVEWELNNRPRKRLKFRTPQEVFTEYLNLP